MQIGAHAHRARRHQRHHRLVVQHKLFVAQRLAQVLNGAAAGHVLLGQFGAEAQRVRRAQLTASVQGKLGVADPLTEAAGGRLGVAHPHVER